MTGQNEVIFFDITISALHKKRLVGIKNDDDLEFTKCNERDIALFPFKEKKTNFAYRESKLVRKYCL